MKERIRKTSLLALRIAVSLGLIAWILLKVDRAQLVDTMRHLKPGYLLLAIAAYFAVNCLCNWRWDVLLRARGVAVNYWRLLRYYLNGLFFSNFLPTTVGGDLMRAYLVADDCSKKTEALASVLVDRFIGLFGVIVAGVIGLILVAKTGQEQALLRYMAIGVVVTLAFLVLFLNKALMRKLRVLLRLPLLARAENQIVDFYHSLYAYRTHKNEVLLAFLQSLSVQLFVVVTAYFIARSLGIDIAIIPFFLYMPVIAAISMVPLSINGWGLQEWAFIVFFGRAGVPKAEALSLGFLYHVVAVIISLIGGLLWLVYGGRKRRKDDACREPGDSDQVQ